MEVDNVTYIRIEMDSVIKYEKAVREGQYE